MEEIIALLASDPVSGIAKLKEFTKDTTVIDKYRKEYDEHDRTIRDTQVANIQKNKNVGQGENFKEVKAVRIPINFAKKIVTTSSAFEVGKPVTLLPSVENNLSDLLKTIWRVNRIDNVIQKLITLKKKETQGAANFYISEIKQDGLFNKLLAKVGLKASKEIKVKVLDNKSGRMTPYFDSNGNMLLFMWEYATKENSKTIQNVEIWDDKIKYIFNDKTGSMVIDGTPLKHGFDRIPIVYVSQDEPEWYSVKEMIDRYEVAISKLGASNDYTAHPLLQIFGEVESFPDKDQSGKILSFPVKPVLEDGTTNPFPHGKAEFLTADNAVDSQKLELEALEKLIHYISNTPNLSFDTLKGIGTLSGVAIKLMFMDAIIKASMNEGENDTMIKRIINVMLSGITQTTNVSLATQAKELYYDVQFNSILPDDIKEAVEIAARAKEAGIMSTDTAVSFIDMAIDSKEEVQAIEKEKAASAPAAL